MTYKRYNVLKWFKGFSKKALLPAAEKIGYTTLGILLALWINNWDESRKKNDIEQKTLQEIQAGLVQDRRDLLETIEQGYQYRLTNIQAIFRQLNQENIDGDSMSNKFTALMGYSYLLANTAGYETLKSRGLETITTDSLRLAISKLYDIDYEAIQNSEKDLNELYHNTILPYLTTHYPVHGDNNPSDVFKNIKQDQVLFQLLHLQLTYSEVVLRHYKEALFALEKLSNNIEIELQAL